MSATEDRKMKRFIPTLTEVLDSSEQMGLELTPTSANPETGLPHGSDAQPTRAEQSKNVDQGSSVSSLHVFHNARTGSSMTGEVQIAMKVDPGTHAKSSARQSFGADVKDSFWKDGSPNAHVDEFDEIGKIMGNTSSYAAQQANTAFESQAQANDFSLDESVLDLHIEDEDEAFSPLSHNPAATEDSLRPSDLMLVALTERIAAKARARVEENLEQHIQTKIFPLLDEFADQLVRHLEGDLLKMIREGLAEATREELGRLRKK